MTPAAPDPLAGAIPARLGPGASVGLEKATGLKNLQQLIQLRWIAVFGQIVTIEVVHYGFRIPIPIEQMLVVLGCLVGFNVLSLLRWRTRREVTNAELMVALLVDIGMLTAQLYLSGGATNPFVFLYLLQVILGAVLLQPWSTWTVVGVTVLCFAGLALFGQPLPLPLDHYRGLASPYMLGMLVCFALNAALLVTFISRITANLRARDANLARLQQRAAEEEHIVRMGLLASGAAHELGTPLSTLAVILGDWQHLPHFTSDPELAEEVTEMEAQVQRCKAIVSGILLSAGEARGESSEETTICTFLDELVDDWRRRRPSAGAAFTYSNRFGQDLPAVSDSALRQMVGNVLDNALEASPQGLHFDAAREGDALVLTVTDQGPGFLPAMLEQLGKPYQSSKGRPGGGLGLFLVVNVARTVGGTVTARNRQEGGAEVKITLPLAAIALAGEEDADVA
ncbi:Sensor histidine kinase RegB [Xylophilus ampelinus]|nr:HAMP domain-containing histidine kinase [Variovorax sp.]VTY37606.1 Sensor histidine kinase RegB [Xylophilus ampelinus]